MNYYLSLLVLVSPFILGCDRAVTVATPATTNATPYVPSEPTPEELELINEYSSYRDEILTALARGGDYELVTIIDRDTSFPENEETYTRVLVLQREVLDLDDYGLSLPGREQSESDSDYIEGFFNNVMFWVNDKGTLLIDYYQKPPGMYLLSEWCVPNSAGELVSLHYGGIPCLKINLAE